MSSRGILMVLAGPSGAGKTTLARHLVEVFPEAGFSVSCTTRPPRGDEQEGVDYRFVTPPEFDRMVSEGHFLEWAHVHGNRYGTSAEWVRSRLASGGSVILDIDVQGALQVKGKIPSAVLVFILPPDRDELRRRLAGRGTDSGEDVDRRLSAAADEVALMGAFDYFVENGDPSAARRDIQAVYRAEGMRLCSISWPSQARGYHPGLLGGLGAWKGRRVVVCSGPTREGIDQVRFLSNRSSGLMGISLVHAFLEAGAEVVLISGPCRHDAPPGSVELRRVENAREMLRELQDCTPGADLLVMAAAVSDFRPASRLPGKIPRGGPATLELETTPDLLESLATSCPVLSFSLEFGPDGRERALEKLRRKGAFAAFLNRGGVPGEGMESETNRGELLFCDGSSVAVPPGSKRFVAMVLAGILGERI